MKTIIFTLLILTFILLEGSEIMKYNELTQEEE